MKEASGGNNLAAAVAAGARPTTPLSSDGMENDGDPFAQVGWPACSGHWQLKCACGVWTVALVDLDLHTLPNRLPRWQLLPHLPAWCRA